MGQAVYRFGRFRVDTAAHALFRDSTRLPIQEQPYQVLLALVENPGQVVTRDALRTRLWGSNTFVDFDQSLNSALRRLRLALEDNSRDPVYVETIPRLGFRFLPEVVVEAEPPTKSVACQVIPSPGLASPRPLMPATAAGEASGRRFSGAAGALATVTFLLGVSCGFLPSQWKRVVQSKGDEAPSHITEGAVMRESPETPEAYPDLSPNSSTPSSSPANLPDASELEGWYHLKQRTQAGYLQARVAFDRTLASRPEDASAMVGVAQTEILRALNGDAPDSRLSHARGIAQQALRVAPHLAAAHAAVGAVDALVDWNDAAAEQEFRTALHLDPHDSLTHQWYAVFVLMPRRQYRQAEAEATVSVREDPLSLIAHTNLGWILYTEGKRQAALEQYSFVLGLQPDFVPARFRISQLLHAEGPEPDSALRQVAALTYHSPVEEKASPAKTSEVSSRCDQLPAPHSDDPQALAVLRAGIQEHCLREYFFGQDPELKRLQKAPEFSELVNMAHPVRLLR